MCCCWGGDLVYCWKKFFWKAADDSHFLKKIFLESRSGLFFFFKKISSNEPVERGPFFLLEKGFFGKLQVMCCFFLIDHIVPTRWWPHCHHGWFAVDFLVLGPGCITNFLSLLFSYVNFLFFTMLISIFNVCSEKNPKKSSRALAG